MSLVKKILFPVDLSDASKKIVPYVKEFVQTFGAELHVLHSTRATEFYEGATMSTSTVDDAMLDIRAREEKEVNEFVATHFKKESVRSTIVAGSPGPEILKYAEAEKLDLIIMGHSSTGLARAVFGSVAGYVVKYSPVPVLVISPTILEDKT
jgi:nucleotide-binding universal stress UspA family protein